MARMTQEKDTRKFILMSKSMESTQMGKRTTWRSDLDSRTNRQRACIYIDQSTIGKIVTNQHRASR